MQILNKTILVIFWFFFLDDTFVNSLTRSKRQNFLNVQSNDEINTIDVRSSSVVIGFRIIQGAKRYRISAYEWHNGKIVQSVHTSQTVVGEHTRQVTIRNLHPGREYLIEVKGLNSVGRLIKGGSEGVVKTAIRCYVCDGRSSNSECIGDRTILECPRGTDSCINDLRFQNGFSTITKRCITFQPEFRSLIGRRIPEACMGTVRRDEACRCVCKSDLCNAEELPCLPRCFPKLSSPSFGSISCDNENRARSTCQWSCDRGRVLEGRSTSVCRSDGTWTIVTPPRCAIPRCFPQLSSPLFGSISCDNENQVNSTCRWSCERGRSLQGRSTSICRSDGTWSISFPPRCVISSSQRKNPDPNLKSVCPELNRLKNGRITCTNGTQHRSVCLYQCENGFRVNGRNKRTCLRSGNWSGSVVTCKRIRCPSDHLTLNHGTVRCTNANRFESVCFYECESGYENVERPIVLKSTCTAEELWDQKIPICTKKQCPLLQNQDNGEIQCSMTNLFESTCILKCSNGYEVVEGSRVITCLENSNWNESLGHCQKVQCELLEMPEHGTIECTDANNFDSFCGFSCDKGYIMVGEPETLCQANGSFLYPAPICSAITCPESHLAIRHGLANCTDMNFFNSVCTYQCKAGYKFVNIDIDEPEMMMSKCLSVEEWSRNVPICEKVTCSLENNEAFVAVYEIGSGYENLSCSEGNRYGSVCKLHCSTGHELNGQDTVRCNEQGNWNETIGSCLETRCPRVNLFVENGTVECTNFNILNSVCSYVCNDGNYFVQGQSTTTECLANGLWSNPVPSCGQNRCPRILSFMNLTAGRIDCTNKNSIGSQCVLQCNPGYNLIGNSNTTCLQNQSWTLQMGFCERVSFPRIGFDQELTKKLTCPTLEYENLENGEILCNNENNYNSDCSFFCQPGYQLANRYDEIISYSSLRCMSDGTWNDDIPKCIPIECLPGVKAIRELILHGRLECTQSSRFKSKCTLTCHKGYEPINDYRVSECDINFQWWPEINGCKKIQCRELEVPPNAARIMCTDKNNFDSACFITQCQVGYYLNDPDNNLRKCNAEGNWTRSYSSCKKMQCSAEYLELENGFPICTNANYFGSKCEFFCNRGFELQQERQVICQVNGEWSVPKPTCNLQISCSSTYFPFGSVSCDVNNSCTLTCDQGSQLVGNSLSLCFVNDSKSVVWSPPFGNCTRINCPELELDDGIVACSERNLFKSTCNFQCNDGFVLHGSHFASCSANGNWNEILPTCLVETCDEDYLLFDHGSVKSNNYNRSGSSIEFNCTDEGFELVGPHSVTCLSGGIWSSNKPVCKRKRCRPLQLPNGSINCTGEAPNEFGSQCQFMCDKFFDLQGQQTTNCGVDGQWTNSRPFCKGYCPFNLNDFQNGVVLCTDSNWQNSKCRFKCDETDGSNAKYNLFGSSERICLDNGRWSQSLPCCSKENLSSIQLDLLFVVDSNEEIGYSNWTKVMGFINQIISHFTIGETGVQIGLFRYSRDIDRNNEIELGEYTDKALLQRAIKFYPFGSYGRNTGHALRYALGTSLKSSGNRGNISDVVILITNGFGQGVTALTTRRLKNKAMKVLAVGIGESNVSQNQLHSIATSSKDVFIPRNGFNGLSTELTKRIIDKLSEILCLQ